MIETDYDNACILLKRNGETIKTFHFKDFVSAKDFKPVNTLKNEMLAIEQNKKEATEEELDKLNEEFFTKCTSIALTNAPTYDEALEMFTVTEISELSQEILIFLVRFSSTEAVKQFGKQLSEMEKKEQKPSETSQK